VAAQMSKKKVLLVDLNKSAVDKALAFMGTCVLPYDVFYIVFSANL